MLLAPPLKNFIAPVMDGYVPAPNMFLCILLEISRDLRCTLEPDIRRIMLVGLCRAMTSDMGYNSSGHHFLS